MTPLQIARSLLEAAAYDYATTDIPLPPEVDDFLMGWSQLNIPEDVLFTDEDGGKGRERQLHVTVKYGLKTQAVPDELRDIAKSTKPFPIFMGSVSLFTTSPNYDVVKIDVESPWLRTLNKTISASLPNEDTHPEYHPHITLAYVQKGTCDYMEGDDPFKSEDVEREFTASGMAYRGPGEEDDPQRAEEMLLFSKVKTSDEVVAEAVLSASPEEMKAIERILKEAAVESQGDPTLFTDLVGPELEPYHIKFAPHEQHKYACAVATPQGAYLRVPQAYEIKSGSWISSVMTVLHHELVHVKQMSHSPKPQEMYDKALAYVTPGGQISHDRYLQQKQEIMAWAASMVEGWRLQGLTTDQMVKRLRSGNWGFGMKYWANRQRFPQSFNRFVKQAMEYIELLKESKLEEDPNGPDPFAKVGFPVDPDRTRSFLQRIHKRPEPRPIL